MQLFTHMIANFNAPSGSLEVVAPFDHTPIAKIDLCGADGVDSALTTAYTLFRDRDNWLSVQRRIAILEKMVRLMREQSETLALEAAREGGKPLIDSRTEVARAIDSIRICVDCMRNDNGRTVSMNINMASKEKHAFTTKEPIGVVVAISAFNHPVNLIAHQVGPAVAAGCPVIVKPASTTPLSCFRLVDLLRKAGLPDEWCQALLTENLDSTTQLVTDERVGFLSFIGSAKVGWKLRASLAPGSRCALEHGGVAPVIIDKDADWDKAIPKLIKGGFYHAGQVCVSVQRVFVHHLVAQTFAEKLADAATELRIGDPTLNDVDVGPLIRPAEVERVSRWVNEAVAEGAKLLTGGKVLSETTYACTVLFDPADSSKVSRDEIFGPVICIYPYSDLDEAISRANQLPWSFQAAVFSNRMNVAMYVADRLDASAVMLNEHTAFRVDWMPFAGLRQSGLGVGGIPYTYEDMQVEKMIVMDVAKLAGTA